MDRNIYDLKKLFQVKSCSEITIEVKEDGICGTSLKNSFILYLEEAKNLIREKVKITLKDKKYIKNMLAQNFANIKNNNENKEYVIS